MGETLISNVRAKSKKNNEHYHYRISMTFLLSY